MGPKRTTKQTVAIVEAFLEEPAGWWYGLELSKAIGLPSGTIYPALGRLHKRWGWLESRWAEEGLPGRPPRRMYRLTGAGERAAREFIAQQEPAARKVRGDTPIQLPGKPIEA